MMHIQINIDTDAMSDIDRNVIAALAGVPFAKKDTSRRLNVTQLAGLVVSAWSEPGPDPAYHMKMRMVVRDSMPILAKRLDALTNEI